MRATSALLAAVTLSACGSSMKSAEHPKVAGVVGESEEQLFAVHWPTSMRAELEASARKRIAVVAMRPGGQLRVLPGCSVEGSYSSSEVSPKEDIVRLSSRDEVKATLPFAGSTFAGRVGAQGVDESVLDVAIVTRRISRAPALPFSRAELRGDCADATHVVTGLVRGAFAIAVRSKRDAAVAAQVFGLAAATSQSRAEVVAKSDASPASCLASARTSSDGSCDALLKISVRPLASAGSATLTSRGAHWGKASCANCNAECNDGSMDACATVGIALMQAGNETKAEPLLRMACDGKSADGCMGLAMLYDPNHNDGRGFSDIAKARALFARACDMGSLSSCVLLALVLDASDIDRADEADVERAARACTAGGDTAQTGQSETCFVVSGYFQRKALRLEASRAPGAASVLDRANAFEKRRCAIALPDALRELPCRFETWERYRAGMRR